MTNKSIHLSSTGIDEALWAAYRRDDKAAVMDYLFHRSLVEVGCSGSFPQLMIKGSSKKIPAARRADGEPVLINGAPRQILLRSTLN